MNNDVKYVIRGTALALIVAITVSAVQSYNPTSPSTTQNIVVANEVNNTKKASTPAIVNIEGQNLFNEHCTPCHHSIL